MSVLFGLSMLLALAGCMLIYLASRHQLWWQHHRDPILLRRGGFSLLALSLLILVNIMQPIAGLFSLLVWIMLLLVLFPYLGVLNLLLRKNRNDENKTKYT